jgi:hypothetical protein
MRASSCRRSAPPERLFASAFEAGWRQSTRAPGSKTICISTIDQEGVLLAATRKRLDDLNSVTSCLKLGQAPYATREESTSGAAVRKRPEGPSSFRLARSER